MSKIETLAKQEGKARMIRCIGGLIFLEDKTSPRDPIRIHLLALSTAIQHCPWMTDEDMLKVAKAFGEV